MDSLDIDITGSLLDTTTAEQAVIGAALHDTSAIRYASQHITDADFTSPRNGRPTPGSTPTPVTGQRVLEEWGLRG